ncbi:MAG TPA: GNAT family N-acetyltransferase [Segetibacter sp.]|jgi:GNAT superfamily N-acetyltransferase
MSCFPASLATKLGKKYVFKTLDWFLSSPQRFLFHIEEDNKVIGYCGGFIPSKPGDGSSSGMLQHAFNEAVKGLILKPWLLFHNEVVPHYPFIWRNIKRKLTGRITPAQTATKKTVPFKQYVGLVVIGVLPSKRGTGVAQQLMAEFENKSRQLNHNELVLSVKKDNNRAIKAYNNYGWNIREEHQNTYVLQKTI